MRFGQKMKFRERTQEIKNKNKKKVRLVFVCVELSYISEDNIKQHLK